MPALGEKKMRGAVLAVLAAALFFSVYKPISDFDTGYHLLTGKIVLEQRSVPQTDFLTASGQSRPWIAHYWLIDVVYWVISCAGGLAGLVAFIGALCLLAYAALIATACLKGAPFPIAAALVVPFSLLTLEMWVVRPQSASYVLTALTVLCLEWWKKTKRREPLLILPLLFLLWGNMHAGVALGMGILAVYCAGSFVREGAANIRSLAPLFVSSGIASLVALLNPYGIGILTYGSVIASAASTVMEWRSILDFTQTWQSKVFIFLTLAVPFLLAALVIRSRKEWREWDLEGMALVAIACVLPYIAIRHVGFFPLLVVPPFAAALAGDKKISRFPLSWFSLFAIAMGALVVAGSLVRLRPIDFNPQMLPVGAAHVLKEWNVQGPVFNIHAQGGYLEYALWPAARPFTDGRSEVTMGEIDSDFTSIMQQRPGWKDLFSSKYKFEAALLWYRAPFEKNALALFESLTADGSFRLVYWDDAAILLVRNNESNAKLIAQKSFRVITPFLEPKSIPVAFRKDAIAEYERAIKEAPESSAILRSRLGI